ncbi:hypothetical protein D3C72_1329030 [compost metagenome]
MLIVKAVFQFKFFNDWVVIDHLVIDLFRGQVSEVDHCVNVMVLGVSLNNKHVMSVFI